MYLWDKEMCVILAFEMNLDLNETGNEQMVTNTHKQTFLFLG